MEQGEVWTCTEAGLCEVVLGVPGSECLQAPQFFSLKCEILLSVPSPFCCYNPHALWGSCLYPGDLGGHSPPFY